MFISNKDNEEFEILNNNGYIPLKLIYSKEVN